MARMIPRIVHQTYPDFSILPPVFREKIQKLEKLNPEYEFRYYDDKQVYRWILDNYGNSKLQNFLRIDARYGAMRADYFRYLLMAHSGGVYLDIKSTCHVPLDHLIRPEDEFILSKWNVDEHSGKPRIERHKELVRVNLHEYQQWFIISKPNHLFLQEVIHKVDVNLERKYSAFNVPFGRKGGLSVTGPIPYTISIAKHLGDSEYREIDSKKEGLEYSVCEDGDGVSNHSELFENHYATQKQPLIIFNRKKARFATLIISIFRFPIQVLKNRIRIFVKSKMLILFKNALRNQHKSHLSGEVN